MESNVTFIRNLVEDNKTYKHVSEVLKRNFPEVTRGFSERNVRLFCAKYEMRRLNEFHRSGWRERGKLVFVFAFFYISLSEQERSLWMSSFLPPHFFVGKKLFLPHHFCRSYRKRFLLVVCGGCSSMAEGGRNKNGTFHTFSCMNDCLNMCL